MKIIIKNILIVSVLFSQIAQSNEILVIDQCNKIGKKLSSVSQKECNLLNLHSSTDVTVKQHGILFKHYPPLKRRAPQAKILLLGGIHGDEYSSVSVVFKWMKILDKHHSGLFDWKIIPLLNPDGLLQKKSKRMNARGVDLNRNFKTKNWQQLTNEYWLKRVYKDPRRYPGKKALSEVESKWLSKQIETFQPDAIISVHAPFGILDFDGPKLPPKKFGYLHLKLLGTYPGSLGNYASNELNIPVITIELPHAGIMPSKYQVSKIWTDLIKWLKKNIKSKY